MKHSSIILILFLLGILLNVGCSSTKNSSQIEQKIILEIFPEIFNYVFEDSRKRFVPPPPPDNDSEEALEKMHKAFIKAKEDYKIFIDTTKFEPLFVIINDSASGIPKSELKRIYNEDRQDVSFIDTTTFKKSFKIDLSKIDLGKDYIVKYRSDFSSTIDELIKSDWLKHPSEEIHLHQFSGMLALSRIYFNKEQNYGFIDADFSCGKLCGCGYRIFIKKTDNEWIIDKIADLGCA